MDTTKLKNKFKEVFRDAQCYLHEKPIAEYMFWKGIQVERVNAQEKTLDASQAALLSKINAALLTDIQERRQQYKQICNVYWKVSKKGTKQGKLAFQNLNEARNQQRRLKKAQLKLEGIQKVLKNIANS